MKSIIDNIKIAVLALITLIMFGIAMNLTEIPMLKLLSNNMAYIAVPCGVVYYVAHIILLKRLIKNKYLHMITFPISAFFAAIILFIYSLSHRSEGISYFPDEMPPLSIYSAIALSVALVFLVVFIILKLNSKIFTK